MPMLVLVGTFQVKGAQPDGDSVRFYPDEPAQWDLVPGTYRVERNSRGGAQVRLDGVDALETHYTPPSRGARKLHQPLEWARRASERLLELLGFEEVERDEDETVTAARPEAVPGYVLTRTADVNGRCVALAGAGDAPGGSGDSVHVDLKMLRATVNHHLMADGLVYPTFYRKLYPELRRELTRVVGRARPGSGLWPDDDTRTGFEVTSLDRLQEAGVILPKLFRRLADYLALGDGDVSLEGFSAYLAQRDDRLFIISTGHWTAFDFVVEVDGQRVRLTRPPEDLLFDER
jgi:hypothetical protein